MLRALALLEAHDVTMAGQFARLMWPEAPAWSRSCRCGYGSTRGSGMRTAGGAYLGRLRKAGLVRGYGQGERYLLSDQGRAALHAAHTSNHQTAR